MPRMSTETQARPLFSARLTPHRSMSARGHRIVMAVLIGLAIVPTVFFAARGAWPIVGFLGLDIVLIWWALTHAFKRSSVSEEVTLWADELEFRQVDDKGKVTLKRFNPFFVKLLIDRDYNEHTTGLRLKTHDEEVQIGAFLSPEEKSSFGKAFGTALRKARH